MSEFWRIIEGTGHPFPALMVVLFLAALLIDNAIAHIARAALGHRIDRALQDKEG